MIEFNQHNNQFGGKAVLQQYSASTTDDSSGDSVQEEPKLKSKKTKPSQPFVLAICTPLMARVHKYVQQSRELIFCNSTSSLDRFNISLFILSTAHPAGGLPIGVILISDEKESTIRCGLKNLIEHFRLMPFVVKEQKAVQRCV